MLGSGCFGIVRRDGEFAIKRNHYKYDHNTLNAMREIDVLTKIKGSEFCLSAEDIVVSKTGEVSIKMEAGVCNASRWCSKRVMLHAALGLEFMHKRNIIHGDVKLANILVFDDRSAKLIDFGLSIQGPVDELKLELYPEKLRAPEIRDGFGATTACDVWAYGIALLMYTKMLTVLDYKGNFFKKIEALRFFGPKIFKRIFDPDPKKRATISEVIDSSYFSEFSDEIAKARSRLTPAIPRNDDNCEEYDAGEYGVQIAESNFPEPVKALATKIASRVSRASRAIEASRASRASRATSDPDFVDVCLMIANKYYDIEFKGYEFIVDNLALEKLIVFDILKGRIV